MKAKVWADLKRTASLATAVIVLLLGQGCAGTPAGAPPPEEAQPPEFTDEYRVGVGDSLTIDVWRNPDLSVSVPVRPDGRISMPLLGDVDVGGKTPQSVGAEIERQLADYIRDPKVSVIVGGVGSAEYLTRVRVTGAVQQPLSIPYRPGMTILDLILEAGGVTEFANANSTRLFRTGEEPRSVKLRSIMELGDLSTNFQLRPGDVVTVPESAF
ncbi:MAG: XrtA/PEP-CTERM system exopolysaccharide export protein [Pseudomonadales bacterium]|jgi:polysaccharide export outer membrane protein|nr:XrtA/PEP-CTERM system exopolysaccharide export protein [Pseudomonadales bacterium]